MSVVHTVLSFLANNPGKVIVGLYVLLNVIVAVTPKKYQHTKVFGIVVKVMHRLSVLTHSDQLGKIKYPGLAQSLLEAALARDLPETPAPMRLISDPPAPAPTPPATQPTTTTKESP